MNDDHTFDLPSPGAAVRSPWVQLRDIVIVIAFLGWLIYLAFPYIPIESHYVALGQVQGLRYFGAFGVNTQVDVRDDQGLERSLVVDGVSHLQKGQEVVLHIRGVRSDLCTPNGTICETLKGRPQ